MGFRSGVIYGAAFALVLCSIVSAVQLLRAQDSGVAVNLGALREPAGAAGSQGRVSAASRWNSPRPPDSWYPSFEPASAPKAFGGPAASGPSRFAADSASSGSPAGGAGSLSPWATGTQAPAEYYYPSTGGGAAGGGRGAGGGSTGDQSRVSRIFFGTTPETACQRGRGDLFLEQVRDLYVCVGWRGLAGRYVEGLTFVAPDGTVYQALTVAFATPGTPLGAVQMEGRSLDVRPSARGADGETLVLASLPVAGTYITQRNLVGLWTVEVSLNGQLMDRDHFVLNSGG